VTFEVPVLVMTFCRPETTLAVINALRLVRPTKLYLASDGPPSGDLVMREMVASTRAVMLSAIDWECDVQTLFSDTNLGLRKAVESAISWMFEREECGIILEDDCIPSVEFFPYCAELLERYRDDSSVWMISGDNSARAKSLDRYSYSFVGHASIWGWATWRRAWQNYDFGLKKWQASSGSDLLLKRLGSRAEAHKMEQELSSMEAGKGRDSWAYIWYFSCVEGNGLGIHPHVNLISNAGSGPLATHTGKKSYRDSAPTGTILPLKHPLVKKKRRRLEAALRSAYWFSGRSSASRFQRNLAAKLRLAVDFLYLAAPQNVRSWRTAQRAGPRQWRKH
jgi:hypothetical protein